MRFWIHFVRVTFTSTKDTVSSYIFKRIFVSMPIHLLILCLLFILSREGGGAICLFQTKLRKFIWAGSFYPGGGGPFAYLYAKKCTIPRRLHLILRQMLYQLNKYNFQIT